MKDKTTTQQVVPAYIFDEQQFVRFHDYQRALLNHMAQEGQLYDRLQELEDAFEELMVAALAGTRDEISEVAEKYQGLRERLGTRHRRLKRLLGEET